MESVFISDFFNNSEDDVVDFGCLQDVLEFIEGNIDYRLENIVDKVVVDILSNDSDSDGEETIKDVLDMIFDRALLKEDLE